MLFYRRTWSGSWGYLHHFSVYVLQAPVQWNQNLWISRIILFLCLLQEDRLHQCLWTDLPIVSIKNVPWKSEGFCFDRHLKQWQCMDDFFNQLLVIVMQCSEHLVNPFFRKTFFYRCKFKLFSMDNNSSLTFLLLEYLKSRLRLTEYILKAFSMKRSLSLPCR